MRRFLRKSASTREPLPLAMAGVRMGERLLQLGLADLRLMTMLASKPGISGRSAILVRDDRDVVRAQSAAADAGLLLETNVIADVFPFDDDAFDVVVAQGAAHPMREAFRVVRPGGRLIVLEPGTREGIASWFRSSQPPASGPDAATVLEQAGFSPVRLLGDREGYRFTEGLKR